jgi:protein-tyrosine phosphatase
MLPLVDTHCHLCAGLDDGPADHQQALQMCQMAWGEGTRWIAATAHQNACWPDVTPGVIKDSVSHLADELRHLGMPLALVPTAEVMLEPTTLESWEAGRLLSVGDRGAYLLVEFPHGLFVDISDLAWQFTSRGVRVIIAHAERYGQLLRGGTMIERLVAAGCVIQVCADSLLQPRSGADERTLRRWLRRGLVHLLGSDGHSPDRRPPHIRAGYQRIRAWAGNAMADRICSTNGLAVLQGRPLRTELPAPRRKWFW